MSTSMGKTPRMVDTPITTGSRRFDCWLSGAFVCSCVRASVRAIGRKGRARMLHVLGMIAQSHHPLIHPIKQTHPVVRHLADQAPADAPDGGAHPEERDEERGLLHGEALLLWVLVGFLWGCVGVVLVLVGIWGFVRAWLVCGAVCVRASLSLGGDTHPHPHPHTYAYLFIHLFRLWMRVMYLGEEVVEVGEEHAPGDRPGQGLKTTSMGRHLEGG